MRAADTLGQYLKNLRVDAKLSLREVERRSVGARMTDDGTISRSQLLHIESGKTTHPTLPKLITLARIYSVPVAKLTAFYGDAQRAAAYTERPAPVQYVPKLETNHLALLNEVEGTLTAGTAAQKSTLVHFMVLGLGAAKELGLGQLKVDREKPEVKRRKGPKTNKS